MGAMGPGGADASGITTSEQTYTGVVKAFNEEKGWGHITCDDTRTLFGRDMFVMRSALRCGKVSAGDTVRFCVLNNPRGPQATEVHSLMLGATWQSQETLGRAFLGTLKLFSEDKGWGFIDCPDTHRMFGKDMFVHKREFTLPTPNGTRIQFTVELAKDGRPEAKNVQIVGPGPFGFPQPAPPPPVEKAPTGKVPSATAAAAAAIAASLGLGPPPLPAVADADAAVAAAVSARSEVGGEGSGSGSGSYGAAEKSRGEGGSSGGASHGAAERSREGDRDRDRDRGRDRSRSRDRNDRDWRDRSRSRDRDRDKRDRDDRDRGRDRDSRDQRSRSRDRRR